MKAKKRNRLFGWLIAVLLLCIGILAIFAWRDRREESEIRDTFYYVALGDSIPNGYCVSEEENIEGYPRILAEELRAEKGMSVSLSEYTKDGITAGGLCEEYLSDVKVQEEVKRADLITVTAGANDILKRFRELYKEISGEDVKVRDMDNIFSAFLEKAAENPELAVKAAEIMSGWEWDDFEKDWQEMMESIRANRREDCRVIVTALYNPVRHKAELGALNLYIEKQIGRVNDIIMENSEIYGYQAAELGEAGIEEHLQEDGLHPDGTGQKMIAKWVWEQLIQGSGK